MRAIHNDFGKAESCDFTHNEEDLSEGEKWEEDDFIYN